MYKEGFVTNIKNEKLKKGINKKIIKIISYKRKEPKWMLKLRLKAYKKWKKMKEPHWLNGKYKKINYQKYIYYSSPKRKKNKIFNQKIKKTFNKLNIPIKKNNKIAVDAIFDSVSVKTTHEKQLFKKFGIIFCSFNKAIKKYSNLVKKYICKVVKINDNFFSTLNTAVSSDGTFIYIPKNTKCPLNLSSYFRINSNIGQFERTIIILDKNSSLKYIEGCSATIRQSNQIHAAVVEIILEDNAKIKYHTIQNWYTGNKKKRGGIFNFVTKRALCKGNNSKISWIQLETGSAITWKYPSSILLGKNSKSEFYSISFTKFKQQSDTGTKVIHIGKNTKSFILSKNIAKDKSLNTNRSLVKIHKNSKNTYNFTKCDSLIIGKRCNICTIPCFETKNKYSNIKHEYISSYIQKKHIFYLLQRGINNKDAISMIINGFCNEILDMIPKEYLLDIKKIFTNLY